jgi:hypothetical protein
MHVPGYDQPVTTTSGVLGLVSTPQFLTTKAPKTTIKGDASKVDPRWTPILAVASAQLSKVWTDGFTPADPIAIYSQTYSADVEARRHADGSLNQADLPPTTGLSSAQLLILQIADSVPSAVLATGQNEFVTAPGHAYVSGDNFDLLAAIAAARANKDATLEASLTTLARNNRNQYNIRWQNRWALLTKNATAANGYAKIVAAEKAAVTLADPAAPITGAIFTFPATPTTPSATPTPEPSALASGAPISGGTLSVGTLSATADPRWGPILATAAADLAKGAYCTPSSAANPIPLYTGTQSAAVESRRRSDGSLNPSDLPATTDLTQAQLTLLRIADSVPNAILATGQNEGVPAAGNVQSSGDNYDLLAWATKLTAMAAGSVPPLVQANGYTWNATDIANNLAAANSAIAANKNLYNLRWQTRWSLLTANGYGDIATAEQACVQLTTPQTAAPQATVVIPTGVTSGGPGSTTPDQVMTVPDAAPGDQVTANAGTVAPVAVQVPISAANVSTIDSVNAAVGADASSISPTKLAALLAGHSDLIAQAVNLGYFGAPGTVPGVDYSGFTATVTVQNELGSFVSDWKDGQQTGYQAYAAGAAVPVVGTGGTSQAPIAALGTLTGTESSNTGAATAPVNASDVAAYQAAASTLSKADQTYWASKIGDTAGTVNNTYDPATLLARWEERAAVGQGNSNLTSQDITVGLAYAQAVAAQAGVTSADVTAAKAQIAKLGDMAGLAQPGAVQDVVAQRAFFGATAPTLQGDLITTAPNTVSPTLAETNALNVLQPSGITPTEFYAKLTSLGYTIADLPAIAATGNNTTFFTLPPKNGTSSGPCVPSVVTLCPTAAPSAAPSTAP